MLEIATSELTVSHVILENIFNVKPTEVAKGTPRYETTVTSATSKYSVFQVFYIQRNNV
jgi:hypothetical protein